MSTPDGILGRIQRIKMRSKDRSGPRVTMSAPRLQFIVLKENGAFGPFAPTLQEAAATLLARAIREGRIAPAAAE